MPNQKENTGSSQDQSQEKPINFEQVLRLELEKIRHIKGDIKDPIAKAHEEDLSGLAFSGGGIRSATFNLGVLQALAGLDVLKRFDYLSTVSGGGYIGSWLAAWIRRRIEEKRQNARKENPPDRTAVTKIKLYIDGIAERISKIFTEGTVAPEAQSVSNTDDSSNLDSTATPDFGKEGFEAVMEDLRRSTGRQKAGVRTPHSEPPPISHLREFSNYLTPRKGLWGTDTWTLAVAYVRNFLLTVSVLVGALAAVVLCVRASAVSYAMMLSSVSNIADRWIYWLLVSSISLAAFFAAKDLGRCGTPATDSAGPGCSKATSTWAVIWTVVAVWMGGAMLWRLRTPAFTEGNDLRDIIWGFLGALALIICAGIAGRFFGNKTSERRERRFRIKRLAAAAGAAFIFFLAMWGLCKWLNQWQSGWVPSVTWLAVMFVPPLMLAAYALFAAAYIGLAGQDLEELEREWLARLIAAVSKWTFLFSLLTFAVICTPLALEWLEEKAADYPHPEILGLLWVAISTAGAWLGRAGKDKGTGLGPVLQKALMAIAPVVFIGGLLLILIAGLDVMVGWLGRFSEGRWTDMQLLAGGAFLTALLTLVWSWRVGVNTFSLHALYGNRLIRAYLGASNLGRRAHPFTNFDPEDNKVRMADLVPRQNAYRGPYLLVNAAINLVHSSRLAWQQRKAGAFLFSPLYCGYEFPQAAAGGGLSAECDRGGYVQSSAYADGRRSRKGISLGKAMTISGAAACPNMGYRTSPALAFLMTVFNVRLGWWLPNTGAQSPGKQDKLRWKFAWIESLRERFGLNDAGRWHKTGPSIGLFCLMLELLGLTGSQRKYIYVSDGGHFENLGLYELVRRRCRHILVCDAEEDAQMTFGGLGIAVERCRTDFGIPIDIDVARLRHDPAKGHSPWHCAVGHVRYSHVDPGQPDGILLYLKASLVGTEPLDIATYAAAHTCFPHESTGDQWFDEMQFESYRALGHHIASSVLASAVQVVERNQFVMVAPAEVKNTAFVKELFTELSKQWYPRTDGSENRAGSHDAALSGLMETLRNDPRLAFLDWQLYPDLGRTAREANMNHKPFPWVPVNYEELRAGFFFCRRLIQFMQQVYHERNLNTYHEAPGLQGWMNLFQRWSLCRMVRYTWTMSAGCYSKPFQTFCAHHLRLETGELSWVREPLKVKVLFEKSRYVPKPVDHRTVEGQDTSDAAWLQAERDHGLDFFETQLACEYLRLYCTSRKEKNQPVPDLFEIHPLQITTENPAQIRRNAFSAITVGFAVVLPENNAPYEKSALLYLRIRPAMRHMGLARKAMKAMIDGAPPLPLKVSEETIAKMTDTEEHWHRRIYLEIYPEQMEEASDSRRNLARMIDHEFKKVYRQKPSLSDKAKPLEN